MGDEGAEVAVLPAAQTSPGAVASTAVRMYGSGAAGVAGGAQPAPSHLATSGCGTSPASFQEPANQTSWVDGTVTSCRMVSLAPLGGGKGGAGCHLSVGTGGPGASVAATVVSRVISAAIMSLTFLGGFRRHGAVQAVTATRERVRVFVASLTRIS